MLWDTHGRKKTGTAFFRDQRRTHLSAGRSGGDIFHQYHVSARTYKGLREEELTAEDSAIMDACEQDETWQTVRQMRIYQGEFLTCLCILVQEVVEEPQTAQRFRGWARRWGEDEADASVLHNQIYNVFQRHVMGKRRHNSCGSPWGRILPALAAKRLQVP